MKPVTLFTSLVFVAAALTGCLSSTKSVQQEKGLKIPSKPAKRIIAKKVNGPSDTLVVDSLAAVFTIVDSVEIEKRKKKHGEDAFYTGADDFVFYSSEAHNYLEKQKMKIIDADRQQYLKFIKNDGSTVVIKLDTVTNLFNLYFFNPAKAPVNADMTNVEGEYQKYFGKF